MLQRRNPSLTTDKVWATIVLDLGICLPYCHSYQTGATIGLIEEWGAATKMSDTKTRDLSFERQQSAKTPGAIWDAIILGAGAAGLMAGLTAAQRGKTRAPARPLRARQGRKSASRGGGRCNFTNLDASAKNYISSNPRFLHFCDEGLHPA